MKRGIVVTMMLLSGIWISSVGAETLEIPGTGACEPLLKELAAAFSKTYPNPEIVISRSIGSKGGINMVITDKNVMARVARPLEGEETKHGLKYVVFAKDVVAFGVGEKVEIPSLTRPQLVDIFSGKIENWQQAGGRNGLIRVLIRQPNDSSLAILQQHIPAFRELKFTDRAKILYHDYEVVDALEKYTLAIGWGTASTFAASKLIKPIAIDQVSPTAENIASGRYGLVCDYALVFKQSRLSEQAKRFVDFLFSDSAKQIMKRQGVVSVDRR